ncbi:tandem-95 repeat protein, partial [Vibrio alginolyticus]|uniref:tandem-95 repeat protein n=7 Tax=Vibrio TaxID=662 RepID=UPI003747DE36
ANIDVLPINDAPVSGNLAYSVDEDNSITLSQEQLLAQASDVEGDALTATNLVVDGDATVTANDDGSFTITPDANFNGDIDITFDINDGTDTIVATADLTVNPVNDLPQPEDQAFTIGEDGVLLFTDEDLLDGATDIDGDDLSVEGVSYTGADGVLTDNGDGTYSFAPNENFNGDVNFTFDVSDGTDTVTANIDVSVTPENDPPVAGSTSYTVHEDNSITISNEQLLANSSDVEGEVAIDSVSYSGADGVFQDNGDGTYTFSPNENFNGEVSLDVVVVDEDGAADSTTAGITVLEVNDPPIAGATSYSVNEDEVITISSEQLLANASDVEGEVAIDSVSYSGSDGIFTDNGDGTFSFAPNENFNGDVSLDVVVTDEDGATASTNASIDVLPINDAPVSGDLAYSVDEDGSITLSQEQLLAQAGDVDGDDLTASNLTVDGNATVVENNDGSFTITPDADFNGDIDLSFDITDGDATIQATADLTVNPVNDLPTVGQPQFVTQEDTSFTFTEEQLLQNAGDIDGDNLTVENVASDSGTLVDNGDGTYTFAPNENFDGNVNVTFDVNDGTATVPAEANIDVQSVVDMPELSIASDLVIASDNFESGSNGWNANTESSQGFETGDMLGRIGGTGGDEAVSKTYDIPSDVNEVNISFSFYEIDSWDGESFQIFVGGEQLTTLENSAFRTQDGTTTLYDSDGNEVGEVIHGASQREGFSGWNDQAHQINLTVPVEDGELQLGFGSTLNQDVWDESFGIDNIEITVADADYQIIGTEDTPVPLDIDAALSDTDGSENLSILIEDVPEGSALSAGVDNGDGTWSLQPGELEGLEFIPSADFNGDVTLTVNATSTDVDTGTTATATQDVTIHISPTNDAPEVTGDITAVTAEDNSITLTQEQLLEHAVDIDGDDLSAINLSTNDENATVEMNEDGSFTITPSENFYGDIEFSYDVTDGEEVVAAGLDLTVTPVNDAPEPQDQAFTVGEDGLLTFTDADLLTGATDVEGDNLTVEGVTYTGADGVLTDNGDGTYSFAPNENFNGDVNFTFDVSDGTDTTSANIDVSVTPENDPPVAGSTSYTVHEDNSITISDEQLLANSSDIEGDVAISSVSYSGNDGVLEINGDGTYTFSPNENFTGDVSLDVVVVDEDGAVDTTTAGIIVLEVNDPPIAGTTSYTIDEDEVITISAEQLLANSSDIEGEVALDSVSYSGSEGIFTDNGDGTFSFAPNQNFNGEVNLDVVVVDEDGATASTTANIDVLPINDAPVSGDLAYSVDEDNSITLSQEQLLAQATDVEGDALTASNLVVDGDATVTANDDGSFTITPDANFNGDIDITFDISDGSDTLVATADLTVNPVNDLPQPEDQAFTIGEDGVLTFTDQDLLDGATDIDGDDLSVEGVTYTGADGVLTDNGDGTYSFAPNENFNGDVNFTFDVSDGTDTTSANIDVSVTPENDPPVAGSTSYTVHEDNSITISNEQLLANSSDIEGDVAISSVSYSGNDGVLEINGDGTYTFSPNENFNGEVSLDVVVVDEDGAVDTTTAGITVLEVNDPPIAGATSYTIDEDEVITISAEQLLANSSDIEGEVALDSVSYSGSEGIFTDNGDGTFSFAPNQNFNGEVNLDVVVVDEDGATASTTANIDVLPINDAPVSGDLAYSVDEDNSITLSQEQLLVQATDVEGDALSASNLVVDGDATVTANDDGSFTITPDANFNGDIDITFDINDGSDTIVATADLTVNPVNDLPQPEDQAFTIGEDGVLLFTDEDLLDGATDIDGDDLSVEGVSYTGADGVLTDNGDGTYSFAPNENFNGDVNFTFDVSDGTDTVTANIDVSVTPENDPPVAGSTSYTVHEDNSITISNEQLLANSSDVEGEVAIDSVSYSGADGVFQDNGDGTYTFSPNENFNGEVSLDVVVVDEDGATDSTTAGITVLEVNDPPIAGATSYSVNEDEVITISSEQLLANASDVEGEVAIDSVSYSGSDGIFTDNGDGTFSFAPNENFNGDVSLDVVVTDEDGATVATNANIDVLPVNDAPVSGDLAYSVDEDGSITLSQEQLLAQAGDVDSDNLEAVNLTAVANATVVENQDGSFTITPDANFNGDIDLSFDLIDNDGASVEVGVDLTVNPINDAPQSTPVNIAGTEDTTILITQDMLLANATDIDNTYDELSAVDLVIDEQYGDLLDNGDGTWSFTPAENFNGDVPMSFGVSDGDLVTPVEGNLNVEAVNDAPEAPTIQMQGEEDVVMVIDPAYIADQVTDLDGDEISVESITVRAPANATLTQQPDGMYHLVTTQDFNGLVELGYTATDGEEVVEGSLNVDVIPVNDAPFNVGNAFMATDEDGAFTFDAGDLMNLFGDIDTENLVVSRIITAEGEDGGEVTDNGDGTWTFTPTGDFAGVSDLQVVVSDGEFETVLDVPVFVRPVADGVVITTDHDGPLVFGEDETGHLGLNVGLIDDSETLSNLVMTGFPVGFEVTDGVNTVTITEPGQYIDLNEWDISDLQMTPPADFNGEFFVTVTATTVDYGDEPEEFEDGIDSGDFETLAGEPVILTADDLIGLAENVDADAGDEVKFVHLADRSQGEIVDNGDGTWTFNPAPGFTGEADIAYVIDKDGVLHDEQTGVVVKEDAPQENASPEIDSISTTEMAADGTLSFTNDDMLSTLSDAEGDSLSIESVSLMEGQGVIETDNQGNYQFTPAEGYTGDVQVGFIATDGENRIESFFNVDIQGEGETTTSEGYALADDGSLTLTEAQLIDELGIIPSAEVLDVADANDAGFFAKSGDEEWTYWPNDDFDGNLAMDVQVNDNGEVSTQNLSIQVADDSAQSDEPQIQTAQASSEQQVGEAQQPEEQAANGADSEEESAADVTAAPGDTISISVPDEVSGNESVDYAEMSGLPDGASVSNALDNGDGSFTLSGNLNQPVSVDLPEGYEGTSEIQFQGYDELGSAVEGASGTVEVEVDDQYTMQGSAQDQQPDMAGMESGGSDWTSAGGQDQGVDFTDDSGSFDSDTQTGTDQGNDFDQSSM